MRKHLSIMYSGGLDSFIAYHYAIHHDFDPTCIYVNLGHDNNERELESMNQSGISVEIINAKEIYPLIQRRLSNQIIPSRNLLFAVIGGMISERVWILALDGEQLGKEHDKSPKFFNLSTELLTYTNNFFQEETIVETPFSNMSKSEIIRWALNHAGLTGSDLLKTRSCYANTADPCGVCLTCVKRHMAFYVNGIDDGLHELVIGSDYFGELQEQIPKAETSQNFTRFNEKRIAEFNHFLRLSNI